MSRIAKILICTVLLLGILSGTAFAEGKPALPGYLLAILLGFGTGHFYIEVDGLPLLLAEVLGLGLGVVGMILASAALLTATSISDLTAVLVWTVISGVGFGVYSIARIVEIVGIFIETDKQQKAGVVASLEPTFELRPDMVSAGVRLRY